MRKNKYFFEILKTFLMFVKNYVHQKSFFFLNFYSFSVAFFSKIIYNNLFEKDKSFVKNFIFYGFLFCKIAEKSF
jgi:hypothetical protein